MESNKKLHWENVFSTKKLTDTSWFQEVPTTSLAFIRSLNLPKTAQIIDVGGGDSYLVDHLLKDGYEHITVLDISEKALEKAKKRLGKSADKIE
jgi:ubiquinone/menaquinone biosynthesis C-methylase UbiE